MSTDGVFVRDTISHLLWVEKAPLPRAEASYTVRVGLDATTTHCLCPSLLHCAQTTQLCAVGLGHEVV